MDLRTLLFKARGYTPLPIIAVIIWQADMRCELAIIGLALALFGEGIRLWGVRAAGGRTRTRHVGAKELCTWGPFAHVRNPLYIGNALIYIGMLLFAGGRFLLPLLLFTLIYLIFQYGLIISLEEETLTELFGAKYLNYKANVPRLLPRLKAWRSGASGKYLPWPKVLRTERTTLLVYGLFLLAVMVKELLINAR